MMLFKVFVPLYLLLGTLCFNGRGKMPVITLGGKPRPAWKFWGHYPHEPSSSSVVPPESAMVTLPPPNVVAVDDKTPSSSVAIEERQPEGSSPAVPDQVPLEHSLAIDVGGTSTHIEQVPNGCIAKFNSLPYVTKLIITAGVTWIVIFTLLRIIEFFVD